MVVRNMQHRLAAGVVELGVVVPTRICGEQPATVGLLGITLLKIVVPYAASCPSLERLDQAALHVAPLGC